MMHAVYVPTCIPMAKCIPCMHAQLQKCALTLIIQAKIKDESTCSQVNCKLMYSEVTSFSNANSSGTRFFDVFFICRREIVSS